ncbi:DUF6650 family protein [Pseudomonas fluorescens]|uniref:Uncharacterized protein n=1 Tax=Pseudomonas fluorescens TaxID=294 RepID=A0A5E7RG38_PSEFL|nr:DUF6650 family protein [Pseudomonas fluorescens]VVP73491.1 hypothetical protein PS922_01079 [Pseudomonas fluorescens]
MKRTFQWLRENLNGISTPVFGVSWQPSKSEREVIRKLLIFLEDRRALHIDESGNPSRATAHQGHPEWLSESVLQIRKETNSALQALEFPPHIASVLMSIQTACRELLDSTPKLTYRADSSLGVSVTNLRPWQMSIATAVAHLAMAYDLDLHENLSRLVDANLQKIIAQSVIAEGD